MEEAAGGGVEFKELAIEEQGERTRDFAKGVEAEADEAALIRCHHFSGRK
jgi:hypothetical protein